LHPNSRKAQQLQRTFLRQNRHKEKQSQQLLNKWGLLIDRLLWFQALSLEQPLENQEQIHQIISEQYLHRFDEELEEFEKEQKSSLHSKPKGQRQRNTEFTLAKEQEEYQKGAFQLPDLTETKEIELLRNWQGDISSIGTFKMISLTRPKSS
jgi:translation machinery-associated protein 16